jgi:hypothetical protein
LSMLIAFHLKVMTYFLQIHSSSRYRELATSVGCMKMLLNGAEVTESVCNLDDTQFSDSSE